MIPQTEAKSITQEVLTVACAVQGYTVAPTFLPRVALSADPIRILLADGHGMVRAGIRAILEREQGLFVVAEVETGAETLVRCKLLDPDVAVIDVQLPDLDGLEVLERLNKQCPRVRTIVISGTHHGSYLRRALRAGAAAYLPTQLSAGDLTRAVRVVARGGTVFAAEPGIGADVTPDFGRLAWLTPRHSSLTEREREVLHMVAMGYSNTAIATQLALSPKTVDSHRSHLMDKLGLHSRADVTRYALTQGYVVAS